MPSPALLAFLEFGVHWNLASIGIWHPLETKNKRQIFRYFVKYQNLYFITFVQCHLSLKAIDSIIVIKAGTGNGRLLYKAEALGPMQGPDHGVGYSMWKRSVFRDNPEGRFFNLPQIMP
jgi:hypothetical protein